MVGSCDNCGELDYELVVLRERVKELERYIALRGLMIPGGVWRVPFDITCDTLEGGGS